MSSQTDGYASGRQNHRLAHNPAQDVAPSSAQSHAYANLLASLNHRIGHDTIDSNSGQHQRDDSEGGCQERIQACPSVHSIDPLRHGADVGDGLAPATISLAILASPTVSLRPTGFWPGKNWRASELLIIATGGALSWSRSSNSRPRIIGIPSA